MLPSGPPGPRPPKPPRCPGGPPGPRPNVPPAPGPPPGPVSVASDFFPKPNDLLNLRFSVNRPGPVRKLIGTIFSPGCGFESKHPYGVCLTVGDVDGQVANAARWLNKESPKGSSAVVTLNGLPELAIMNGLRRNAYGKPAEPPINTRWRTSNAARPKSSLGSYGF